MRRRKDDAVTPIIGFVVATVLFTVTFYYVIQSAVERDADVTSAENANYNSIAQSIGNAMMEPGSGWLGIDSTGALTSANLCTATVSGDGPSSNPYDGIDRAGRFGLGAEECATGFAPGPRTNQLAFNKLSNLFSAKANRVTSPSENKYVDYQSARESLGLDDANVDFHIRSWPVMPDVRELLRGNQDETLQPLYIGHYDEGVNVEFPRIRHSASIVESATYVTVTFNVQNLDPAGPESGMGARFEFTITMVLKEGTVTLNQHSPWTPVGSTSSVSWKIKKTNDWDWGLVTNPHVITYIISDPVYPVDGDLNDDGSADDIDDDGDADTDANLNGVNDAIEGTVSFGSIDMDCSSCGRHTIVTMNLDRLHYTPPFSGNQWPEASYEGYKGDGDPDPQFRPNSDNNPATGWRILVTGPMPDTPYGPSIGGAKHRLSAIDYSVPGLYTVSLFHGAELIQSDYLGIDGTGSDCNFGNGDYTPAPSSVTEAGYVDRLFLRFVKEVLDPRVASAGIPSDATDAIANNADVIPDVKCVMQESTLFEDRLLDASGNPRYDYYSTIVVGSDVQHSAMTSDNVKGPIEDWVRGGGTLVVFGSVAQAVQWLTPIFQTSITTGSGSTFTPDENHPVLTNPNDLDPDSYTAFSEWDYNGDVGDSFEHVVPGTTDNDVLSVTAPGTVGLGRIVLTGWRPYQLQPDMSQCPPPESIGPNNNCHALFVIHNLLTLSYRELYLDYGPAVPLVSVAAGQMRIGTVYHDGLAQVVPLHIQVFAFQGN